VITKCRPFLLFLFAFGGWWYIDIIKSPSTSPSTIMTGGIPKDNDRSRQGRIPATLQAVFLASNRGKEVYKPPPAKVADKVFFRNWLFQRQAESKEKDAPTLKKKRVKKLKKKVKQDSPKGKHINNPKANVSDAAFLHSQNDEHCHEDLTLTLDTIDWHSHSRQSFFCAAQHADLVSSDLLGCHDPFPWILYEKIQDTSERILQQAYSVAAGELPCPLVERC
jgi:hypothetical protein